jgi:hypothetical protein
MKLEGVPDLVEAYVSVIMLSEIGEHALMQFSDYTLKIARAFGSEKTLFDGRTCTLNINVDDLSPRAPEEQCAVLCHETFHFFHFAHDPVGYRFRNTIGSENFDTQEEELTIKGTTSDAEALRAWYLHALREEGCNVLESAEPAAQPVGCAAGY